MAQEIPEKDTASWDQQGDQFGYRSGSQMATSGLSWFHTIRSNTYMKLMLSSSAFNPLNAEDSMDASYELHEMSRYSQTEMRSIASLLFNTKISARHILRYGAVFNNIQSWNGSYYYTYLPAETKHVVNESDFNTSLVQGFFQWKYAIREQITLTTGAHMLHLLLNGKTSIEPRLAMRFGIGAGHALSLGFGLHGLMQPTAIYFAEVPRGDGTVYHPNKTLGFTKALHYVIGYDWMMTENIHFKLEAYYQDIRNVPISLDEPENSLLNFGTDDNIFITSTYRNEGLGRNYGLELTLEKFFSKGSYFLVTASLFNSEYRDGNNIWRNTRYNSNYAVNGLAGKEFKLGKKKNNIIGIHTTIVYIGGQRYTPIDLDASRLVGYAVRIDSLAFHDRMKNFFKIDLRLRYRINSKRVSHEIAIEAANILNRKNVEGVFYNRNKGEIDYQYGLSLIPLAFYRLMF
jgi:hypothetical protein